MIVFDVLPVAKPRMTRRDKWAKRPVVVRYFDYCNKLKWLAGQNGYILTESLSLKFVIPMPKSWSQKKRLEMDGQGHTQTPDLDNLIKGFKDALAKNDSYVYEYDFMRKEWGEFGSIEILKTIRGNK